MIAVPAGVRVLVATKPVDFRKGGDGLAALVQEMLEEDPFSGTIFIFRSKRADRLKILAWDGSLGVVLELPGFILHLLQFEERTLVFAVLVAAARSMSRSHRLQCLTGRFDPGASYKQAWAL